MYFYDTWQGHSGGWRKRANRNCRRGGRAPQLGPHPENVLKPLRLCSKPVHSFMADFLSSQAGCCWTEPGRHCHSAQFPSP